MRRKFLILLMTTLINLHVSNSAAQWQAKGIVLIPIEPQQFQDKPIVLGVTEGSPAAIAGLEVGDLIISVNEKEVLTKSQFVEVLRKEKARGSVSFCILRDGMTQTLTAEFRDQSQRFGIGIGDYFLIARKRAYPPTIFHRKGNFGMGVNGVVSGRGIAKFNIRLDNFSENDLKISSGSIMAIAGGTELHRLSPEDVVGMVYPEARGLEDAISLKMRRPSKREQSLLRRKRKELEMLSQLNLKDAEIPPKGFIIGSLFYDNSIQSYPIDLKVEVGDRVFKFSFDQ